MKKQVVSAALIIGMMSPMVHAQTPAPQAAEPGSFAAIMASAKAVGDSTKQELDQYLEGRFQEAGTTIEVKNGVVTILADLALLKFLNRISDSVSKLEGQSLRESTKLVMIQRIRTEANIDADIRQIEAQTEARIREISKTPGFTKRVLVMQEADRVAMAAIRLQIEAVSASRSMTEEAKASKLAELDQQLKSFEKVAAGRRIPTLELTTAGQNQIKSLQSESSKSIQELMAERNALVSSQSFDGNERISQAKAILEGRVKGTVQVLEADKQILMNDQKAATEKVNARLASARTVSGKLLRLLNLSGRVFVIADASLAAYIMVGVSRDGEVLPLGTITVTGTIGLYETATQKVKDAWIKALGWVEQEAAKARVEAQKIQ